MKIAVRLLSAILLAVFLTACAAKQSAAVVAAQASEAYNQQDYPESARLCRIAIELQPDFAEAWVSLGLSLWKQQQPDAANAAWETALKLHEARFSADSSHGNQLLQQIFVLSLLGRHERARELWEIGHTRYPAEQAFAVERFESLHLDDQLSEL